MEKNSKQLLADKLFRFSIVFLVVYLALSFLFPKPDQNEQVNNTVPATIKAMDEDYAQGQLVTFEVENNTAEELEAIVEVEAWKGREWSPLPLENGQTIIAANKKELVSFTAQNTELFTEQGRYLATLKSADGESLGESEFTVEKAGFWRTIWRTLFFKPIYNLLVVCLEIAQSHLFVSIVLLTIIIKLILLVPSKKAILSQQKMQKVQPEIEKLKKKHKADPQKQAQEMMALWKKHKVSPGAAFVPTLIQFPVLIALFFVVKDGLMPHNSFLTYPVPFLQNFDFNAINFEFLWLNLDKIDPYFILPISIGLLQFWQMKTMQAKRKKQKNGKKEEASQQETIMNMMTYFLPAIVVVFSATLPAAVGVYWGTSTIFAIAQQRLLKKDDDVSTGKKGKKDKIVDVEVVEEKPKKTRIKA